MDLEHNISIDLDQQSVFIACTDTPGYGAADLDTPELPVEARHTQALVGLRRLLHASKLDQANFGSAHWNPFGDLITTGAKVVLKPNWVHHKNHSGAGLECLVTHSSVIEAVMHYVIKAKPKRIVLGDAPIQGCDFAQLCEHADINGMLARLSYSEVPIELLDFRMVILPQGALAAQPTKGMRTEQDYILFDLAESSLVDEITTPEHKFRVTMYNPDDLLRTHAPGRHQYLVAREIIDADVVINLPKLKTHKKAGITGALKNMVGINGHKSYLAHHRKGGPHDGGDCYPESSRLKRWVEDQLDATHRTPRSSRFKRRLHWALHRLFLNLAALLGHSKEMSGSWYGNDTVWRMCLDLQRILQYGNAAGLLDCTRQRQVISITDAIICGEGDGPLAPTPRPLGILTLATNPAAAEWVHAYLMGLAPQKLKLIARAFDKLDPRLADFEPATIQALLDGLTISLEELAKQHGKLFQPPPNWIGYCEL